MSVYYLWFCNALNIGTKLPDCNNYYLLSVKGMLGILRSSGKSLVDKSRLYLLSSAFSLYNIFKQEVDRL